LTDINVNGEVHAYTIHRRARPSARALPFRAQGLLRRSRQRDCRPIPPARPVLGQFTPFIFSLAGCSRWSQDEASGPVRPGPMH
jgi:hypothetical protein